MVAVRLSLTAADLPDSLETIRKQIERDIPMGTGGSHKDYQGFSLLQDLGPILGKHPDIARDGIGKASRQLGTLGSGNHFIEICLDEVDSVWVMLHSGSRGIGNMIGNYFIEKAKKKMEMYYINLPDGDLAYLPEGDEDFNDYIEAVHWAQDYALENRKAMLASVLYAISRHIPKEFTVTKEAINCHHNYVAKENHFGRNLWITRKGAVRARNGDLGIIPGSMGTRSYIVEGKGNLDSFCSCSHGAGRAMSRAKARATFTVEDHKLATAGVECRKDESVIDETPGAYKDIETVMSNQDDLVTVLHTLKQVMCVKG
jgi:tRNA-splicing ligase RtcB